MSSLSPVSQSIAPIFSNSLQSSTFSNPLRFALSFIFFSSLVEGVGARGGPQAGGVGYITCCRDCIGDSQSVWKTILCSAICTPFLIIPS